MAIKPVLTFHEQEKLTVITRAIKQQITNDQAAKLLGLSVRQVKRLKARVRKSGAGGVSHGLKGKTGNHRIISAVKEQVLTVITQNYFDFKPSFATEKLREDHNLTVSPETTRLWMIEKGLWKVHKQKVRSYRAWRARKDYFGQLIQFDGSYHFWLENRYLDRDGFPLEMCLLAAIDDATGQITKATFAANEGVAAVFTFWKEYSQTTGKPVSIYLDKFSTYKINHKLAADNAELMTQFGRAAKTLEITLISANSPEAKGRVERLFQTLQDRLVKELRLAEVATPDLANRFLTEIFIPKFNCRFGMPAVKTGNVHRELSTTDKKDLDRIFSLQETRRVNADFTIQFKKYWYQLEEIQPVTIRPKETVLTEVWLDGSVHFSLSGKYLAVRQLPARPVRHKSQPVALTNHKLIWQPSASHPWKRSFKG